MVEIILDLFMSTTPAVACSLIRYDLQQRTLPVVYRTRETNPIIDKQIDHLSTAAVSHKCEECSKRWPSGAHSCPLFTPPLELASPPKLHCLQMVHGDQVYGTLTLYLEQEPYPSSQEKILLEMMTNETTLALETHALRSREMTMLNSLQKSRQLSSLHDELTRVLVDTINALEVTGGVLFQVDNPTAEPQMLAEAGQPLGDAQELVMGLAIGSAKTETPLVIGDLDQEGSSEIRSLLIAPLRVSDRSLGSMVLWAAQPDLFNRRRSQLVATVAGQAALLIENHRLYLRGEQRAVLAERARLAREIHDGLAQTIGYLKLRTAQIHNLLQQGNDEQAQSGLDEVQQMLGKAYVDTREAIDSLRFEPKTTNLQEWSTKIIAEFESLSGVPVSASGAPDLQLPSEVLIQIQRIIQEAFSNIRKHADATRVWLEWQQNDYWLTLYIKDNGCGFDPGDMPPFAQHGLIIMRERAELLDADFQLASQEDQGTQVTIRLPFKEFVDEAINE